MAEKATLGARISRAIFAAEEKRQDVLPRGHLGASQMGKSCMRQVWYGFRWAKLDRHTGRMLRLFRRGHNEEWNVVAGLLDAGAEVRMFSQRLIWDSSNGCYFSAPWDQELGPSDQDVSNDLTHHTNAEREGVEVKQWRFLDHLGHFGGSCDGMVRWPEMFGDDKWRLLEFKTHNDKSFSNLTAKGVRSAKPEHHFQTQIYMHYFDLKEVLYVAVCKSSDDIHCEVLPYRAELALLLIDRAQELVSAINAPPRINDDPSWWVCRFCEFREICHYDHPPEKNCRSCLFARATADKQWTCEKHGAVIPASFIPKGCDDWDPI